MIIRRKTETMENWNYGRTNKINNQFIRFNYRRKIILCQNFEIQKGEERNIREWRKHLDKLVNTFNQKQNDTNINNLLKIVGSDTKAQHHSKNKFFNYKKPMERISLKVINLSNIPLSSNEINIIKFGLFLILSENSD